MIFNNFKIRGENDRHIIRIYGLDENSKEELIYEMEFNNRELMLHVYHSLLQTLESRLKIKNLPQLFAKTKIPIITGLDRSINELTSNILKKTEDEFKKWLKEEKIQDVEPDIVKIENQIEDIEARIDALVFRLYSLNENEVNVVLSSLHLPPCYQQTVMKYFKGLI